MKNPLILIALIIMVVGLLIVSEVLLPPEPPAPKLYDHPKAEEGIRIIESGPRGLRIFYREQLPCGTFSSITEIREQMKPQGSK